MGSAGMRFGRNVPLSEAFPDTANLLTPSPRQVSLELLTRTTFQPATILNVIAAAWIQFMVHDWFVHKKGTWTHTHDIPLDDGDNWHERPMRVPKTPADAAQGRQGSKRPPAYINENTHWWDGSHVYGSSPARPGVAARRPRWQGARQPERPARRRSGDRPRDHRVHRERLGGPEPAARRCSRSSTTRFATTSRSTTRYGTTSGCSSRRAWSTRRCSRRFTPWSGRPRFSRGTSSRPA